MALTTWTRTERRAHLADRLRIERLEEDADESENAFSGFRQELKAQTKLLFTILVALLAGVVALAANLIVAGST